MASADTVNLFSAYYWDCPSCRHRNFTRGIDVPQDMLDDALRDEMELEEWEEVPEDARFEAVMIPSEVKCDECNLEFFTHDPREDEDKHDS